MLDLNYRLISKILRPDQLVALNKQLKKNNGEWTYNNEIG